MRGAHELAYEILVSIGVKFSLTSSLVIAKTALDLSHILLSHVCMAEKCNRHKTQR
jgi:hypothetical protein